MTEEQIDDTINHAFIEQNENALNDFIDNYDMYKNAFEEIVKNHTNNVPADYVERFTGEFSMAFASFKLAQDTCVNILKQSLKELLCEPSDNERNEKREGESNV